ncbi:MAG: hypothetical protein ACJA0V_000516 [Planctomycetota bacterium]|jgi:hypothetical protein
MTSSPNTSDQTLLRGMLQETPTDPAAAARELSQERSRLQAQSEFAVELLGQEQRWLEGFHKTGSPELRTDLLGVRRDWLALRIRHLAAADVEASVLLDLAEAQALAQVAREKDLERQCEEAIDRGIDKLNEHSLVGSDVAERFALLTTAIEELTIKQQMALMRCTGDLLLRMGAKTGSRRCRRLGKRLLRAGDDRELAGRLERRLGRRGVTILETTNFVLLLVVLVTLVIEEVVDLTPVQLNVFHWIDAIACLFFIADFVFELVLHPSRWSWFRRNALTDLVPAIPSVLFFGAGADNLLVLRMLRLLRVTWAARYVQALRPLLRAARLLLFLVRGLDGLAARFAQVLNREFVFVPAAAEINRTVAEDDLRDVLFEALRREHELVELLPRDDRRAMLHERVGAVREAMGALQPAEFANPANQSGARDVAIGDAIEFLWSLRTQDIGRYMKKSDVQALDRVVRVMSVVPVRWLPFVSRLAVHPLPETPEERIVELGRRVADWLESWHGRMLFFADLHGIVTGPQILDRVASAIVKATQRPAVRLLLFGGVFLGLNELLWDTTVGKMLNGFLEKIVGMPLVVLGSFCLVFLILGHWLKRLAGQASDSYRLTSESHFISQLERVQSRYEQQDIDFLTTRVFGDPTNRRHARAMLEEQIRSVRTGVPIRSDDVPVHVSLECNHTALLYLHFLDGAPLHISDVKTTEQLLANQSLENLRREFLQVSKRDRKRLRKLKLDDGTLLSGPYLWFRFITESVAVESAKRISGYNNFCVPLAQRSYADAGALENMDRWLQRRRDPRGGRSPKESNKDEFVTEYPTTEFTALDFLGGDRERDRHIAAVFGEDVLDVVRFDRRTMVREIFGTRPVNHLKKHERSFNPLRFYEKRLSHGRVLLAPLLLLWRFFRTIGWVISKVRHIVREVLDPDVAMQRREIGEAPFAVALRKIHRMKAPGLLEAIRMRLRIDPGYSGAPIGWTPDSDELGEPEIERDLRFLHLREREAVQMRDAAEQVRREVAALHAIVDWLPTLHLQSQGEPDRERRRAGELAVTCAWISNKDKLRTLMAAERWRIEVVPALLELEERRSFSRRAFAVITGVFVKHPVDLWLERHGKDLPKKARAALRFGFAKNYRDTRDVINAWHRLPADQTPASCAIATLQRVYRHGPAVRRDILALRAVQSLAVLDVRNYRDLVFRIGDYESDGEDPSLGRALP